MIYLIMVDVVPIIGFCRVGQFHSVDPVSGKGIFTNNPPLFLKRP